MVVYQGFSSKDCGIMVNLIRDIPEKNWGGGGVKGGNFFLPKN